MDIEFAWDDEKLYILQCRSLSIRREINRVVIPPDIRKEDILFITRSGLSNAVVANIEYVVYVDPRAYDRLGPWRRSTGSAGPWASSTSALPGSATP